jgi:Fe-S-cluster containining protein
LTKADITLLAQHLGLHADEFIQRFTTLAANRAQLTLVEQAGGACCFLEADNMCRVYPARPQQCRDFPTRWRVSGCPALPS